MGRVRWVGLDRGAGSLPVSGLGRGRPERLGATPSAAVGRHAARDLRQAPVAGGDFRGGLAGCRYGSDGHHGTGRRRDCSRPKPCPRSAVVTRAHVQGNKGAVAIRFRVFNGTVCFVNAHLAAGANNAERRNQHFHEICRRTVFVPEADAPIPLLDHECAAARAGAPHRRAGSGGC